MEQKLSQALSGKAYYIYRYGCMMNDHEAEAVAGILEELGCSLCKSPENADIVVFNTCAICHEIEYRALAHMNNQKGKLLVVCGCMPQRDAAEIAGLVPDCQILFGTGKMHRLKEYLYRNLFFQEQIVSADPPQMPQKHLPLCRSSRASAYVSISNGCSNYCAYCIVPFVRGREACRKPAHILREIESLVAAGYQDITLLGQNVTHYHMDGMDFGQLLRRAANTGIPRLRFYTSNPRDMNEEILHIMAETPNICKNLHLPAQSGSNEMLKAMGRGYTRERYIELAQYFYRLMPEGSLTSDFMVGFPGETEEQYQETEALYKMLRFDDAYLFAFSPRPNTRAAGMASQVDTVERQQRLMRLEQVKQDIRQEKAEAFRGTVQSVLVEERQGSRLICRMDNNWYVNAAGNGSSMPGDFAEVLIDDAAFGRLSGILL